MVANPDTLDEALAAVRGRWGVHSLLRLDTYRTARAAPNLSESAPPWWPVDGAARAPQVLELIGPASGGKLSLALLWLAALPSDGPLALVEAADRVLYPPAAAACGLDLRRLVLVRPPRRRELLHVVLELTRSEGFAAVLGSLEAAAPVSLAEAGQLRSFAASAQTSVLLLREAAPHGGEASLPLTDTRLRIEHARWLWGDRELAGQHLRVRTERSRLGRAGDVHEITLRLYRQGSHGSRADHLYLGSTLRVGGGHALAATGS